MSKPLIAGRHDPIARETLRLEVISGVFTAATLAVLDMGPALAKKGFQASDFQVALLTSGPSLGLILSFFVAHYAKDHLRVPLVFWLQLAANLLFCPVFFLKPTFSLAFVVLHCLARIFWSMSFPAQIVVYQSNFPSEIRGQIVGRIRQIQFFFVTVFALLLSMLLDWNVGQEDLVALFGDCPIPVRYMLNYVVPAAGVVGILGTLVYRRIREVPFRDEAGERDSVLATVREFARVLKEDRYFRRYESFFFVFGFANIMSVPLVQIHAVDELQANYFDLAMINVIIVQGAMALTMAWWGRRIDRYRPTLLRAVLNLVVGVDFLALALAPTIGWVYIGRLFRGMALGGGTLLWMLGSLYFAKSSRNAAVYTGIHTVLTGIRWGIAPFAGVLLKNCFQTTSRPIFWIAFIILVVTALGLFREARREDRRVEQ